MLINLIISAFMTLAFGHSGLVEEGFWVKDPNKQLIKYIKVHKSLIVDHMTKSGYEVYGPHGTKNYLDSLGADIIDLEVLESFDDKNAGDYPTPEEIESKLQEIVAKNSDIMKLVSIGQSREGRNLWVVKVSDNPDLDETEPETKYIANMHGNEIVGREMMVEFLRDIGERYHKNEAEVLEVVNNTEIFIMPSMNPDGALKRQRGNSAWRDLNRNFPDFTTQDNRNVSTGREPETVAVMNWHINRNFALSANFHGGTKVVNYPWDTSRDPAPLTDLITDLSTEYASKVKGFYDSTEYPGGIVNGNAWYEVDGGMQDWSYYYHDDLQVTIELSHTKWPPYAEIPQYYIDNKWSLLRYLKRVHQGAGIVLSDRNESGKVAITRLRNGQRERVGEYSLKNGEYYKVLPAGTYEFQVSLDNGQTSSHVHTVSFDFIRSNGNFALINVR